jgi:hypothetical protein
VSFIPQFRVYWKPRWEHWKGDKEFFGTPLHQFHPLNISQWPTWGGEATSFFQDSFRKLANEVSEFFLAFKLYAESKTDLYHITDQLLGFDSFKSIT